VRSPQSVLGCRFFRSGQLGRRAASLCLFVIFFNLLSPVFWVSAHQRADGDVPLCLVSGTHEDPNGATPHDDAAIIHCPLCALLAGAMVAPPSQPPSVVAFAVEARDEFNVVQQLPFAQLPPERHPTPRGPPALV
jgi:hypothetical protein